MRTNAPRMVTVLIALALLALGLTLTLFEVASVTETVSDFVGDTFDVRRRDLAERTDQVGWASLLLSNLLLVVGSIFKGV